MDITQLSNALENEIAYPEQMKCIESGIQGRGFYPGCRGFSPHRSPIGGIMLLGRDFGTKSYYDRLVGSPPRDETALTWRNTRDIYFAPPPHSSLNDLPVWCSNYLMGVRTDGPSEGNIKDYVSTSEWVKFEDSCWRFLQKQVLLMKPLLIVVFGTPNKEDLLLEGRLGKELKSTLRYIFMSNGESHTSEVTFSQHPAWGRGEKKKDVLRLEVKRIRELYESYAQRNR
jgi:hypothetical protein